MVKLSRIAFVILLLTSVIVTIVNMVRQLHSVTGAEPSAIDLTLAMEIDTLKAKLQKEQTRTKNLQFQLRNQASNWTMTATPSLDQDGAGSASLEGMCGLFSQPVPSTMSIWSSHLGHIIKSTRHPKDGKLFHLHDYYSEILHMMTPDRLQRSVKSIPHNWAPVKNAMDVAYQRWLYVNGKLDPKEPEPRRLKIVVFGGSVMVGVMCRKLSFSYTIPRRECIYTYRLQLFLNNFFGGDIVEAHNMAVGGTNSETGYTILKYDLLEDGMKNPDIIINSYSTNDMHYNTIQDAKGKGQTLKDKILEINQKIVRQVMKPACGDDSSSDRSHPLYIHMDDYLGNEQRDVLGTTELSQGIHVLASYYGFLFVSYADVLRDIVYGDTKEAWFSPKGWYHEKTGEYEREIHPGMAMHITSTWLMAYNFLNLATSYCSIAWSQQQQGGQPLVGASDKIEYSPIHGLPPLVGKFPQNEGKPKPLPLGLPPELNKDLLLEDISDKWRSNNAIDYCGPTSSGSQCVFSLFCGQFTKQTDNETFVQEVWSKHVRENQGWVLVRDYGKLGFVPTKGLDSKFTMEFPALKQPIHVVTFMNMKSYGEKWSNSRVKAHASIRKAGTEKWIELTSSEMEGFHGKNTSEIYTHEMQLSDNGVEAGHDLRIGLDLIGGSTFKLIGLAVCS
mmetsp:Transcript_13351/g.24194  ORF Transcript_13351/g.24194 Transcript_13351/m.24194 type:complete len:671 (-) Transcript_13351:55-2067(-)|eukprot:CAMPEP_0198299146 /NCGR_PEP_ID=MMETSP1449-20131203/43584_1 /TAXON_ID=420275 /ORGANISM="Attheya septentrionalis, Strain CCMP2084" /LENGTH=670 /DNA_ID=CAMNT_0044000607 /DNA_START=236 /DNA_END=2248 /DNA_ORIENTATION=+